MNVRIQNGQIGGLEGTEAKRTQSTSPASPLTTGAGNRLAAEGDQVEISAISDAISAAADVIEAQRAGRVKALSALVHNGGYQVPAAKLADAIVTVALDANGSKDLK
jgi:anti-sigma28 factor (negative regulator of flagellin synthesis)